MVAYRTEDEVRNEAGIILGFTNNKGAVSYTHLTLPTICSV